MYATVDAVRKTARVYEQCYDCRAWLNTMTTDHVIVKLCDGSTAYVHTRPCFRRLTETEEHDVIEHVRMGRT